MTENNRFTIEKSMIDGDYVIYDNETDFQFPTLPKGVGDIFCNKLNQLAKENHKLQKSIQTLKNADTIQPVTTFKELLQHNIKIADIGAEYSHNAWNDYTNLKRIWDQLYPEEEWDTLAGE